MAADEQNEYDEDYAQGTWENMPPRRRTASSWHKPPRKFIDVEALKRLHDRGYDARPKDEREPKRG